ncbi:hypothetical protein IPL85_05725 [Candidatus Saccharibacteria bacterium]|nr:MAG: hypothetical protein IPL85_05725 [Candidatus Saccharibacteria bacterium]
MSETGISAQSIYGFPTDIWPPFYGLMQAYQHCDAIERLTARAVFDDLMSFVSQPDPNSVIPFVSGYSDATSSVVSSSGEIRAAQAALAVIFEKVMPAVIGVTVRYTPRPQDAPVVEPNVNRAISPQDAPRLVSNVWLSPKEGILSVPEEIPAVQLDENQLTGRITAINVRLGTVGLTRTEGTELNLRQRQINVLLFREQNKFGSNDRRTIVNTGRLYPVDEQDDSRRRRPRRWSSGLFGFLSGINSEKTENTENSDWIQMTIDEERRRLQVNGFLPRYVL